ncbi:MAG: hypothetical protein ABGW78_09000 [Pirellulales bacterium]
MRRLVAPKLVGLVALALAFKGMAFGRNPERIALLPPIEFNLEEDAFSNEPLSDVDPSMADRKKRRGGPYGSSAPVSLGSFWSPAVSVSGQADTLALNAEFARIAIPLVTPEEGRPLWFGIGRFSRLEITSDAVLPDSGQRFPDQLWLIETGVTHIRPRDDGSSIGGTFLFGSASDQPYAAGRDLTLMSILFMNRPARRPDDEWSFSLFYSPTSQLPYPLPGLSYIWRPVDVFEAKLGVPAGLEWRPTDAWTLSMNYFPLVNVNATLRRKITNTLSFVSFYRTDTEIYFLADRVNRQERFYVFDQRAACGFEQVFGKGLSFEIMASYLFDREIFQGTSFSSGRTDVVKIESGLGVGMQLLWRR